MKKLLILILAAVAFAAMAIPLALADDNLVPEFNVKTYLKAGEKDKNEQEMAYFDTDAESGISPIMEVILKAIDMLVTVIGSVAVLILIIGGILLATASGNEQQIQKGKDAMKYAIIALMVTFLSFIIVTFVQSVLT